MPYIGNQPAESFTSFATQEFSTSATTSYTLDHAVTNENEIALFINNVRQQPGSGKAYTATGTALTLSAATASTDTMYCVFLGRALQTVNPATNSIDNTMISSTAAIATTKLGAGAILQVVQDTKTDQFETSSTSFAAVTGLSAAITPNATSSKILIMCSTSAIHVATTSAGGETLIRFYNGTTAIGDEYQVAKSRQDGSYSQEVGGGGTAMFLYSPSTTSETTINVYARITNGSAGRIGQSGHGSTLTLMEVAG